MGTQQVQRRGRRRKGNLRKQPGVGHPSQAVGPVPSSPFSDPLSLRHKHTYSCSPGLSLRAILDGLDYTGVTIHTRQKGQDKEETRFQFPGQSAPDGAHTHRAPSWKQTFACDKIYASGQEGRRVVPTPSSWSWGALVLRSGRQALLSHDWASY